MRWTFDPSRYIIFSLRNRFLATRDIESLHVNNHTQNKDPRPTLRLLTLRKNKASTSQVK